MNQKLTSFTWGHHCRKCSPEVSLGGQGGQYETHHSLRYSHGRLCDCGATAAAATAGSATTATRAAATAGWPVPSLFTDADAADVPLSRADGGLLRKTALHVLGTRSPLRRCLPVCGPVVYARCFVRLRRIRGPLYHPREVITLSGRSRCARNELFHTSNTRCIPSG